MAVYLVDLKARALACSLVGRMADHWEPQTVDAKVDAMECLLVGLTAAKKAVQWDGCLAETTAELMAAMWPVCWAEPMAVQKATTMAGGSVDNLAGR